MVTQGPKIEPLFRSSLVTLTHQAVIAGLAVLEAETVQADGHRGTYQQDQRCLSFL